MLKSSEADGGDDGGRAVEPEWGKPVERLFPFVKKARILIVGRQNLANSKRHLQFLLLTRDLSEGSRREILREYATFPIVQHYHSDDLLHHFGLRGTKVVGFRKSGLSKSVYSELKRYRVLGV